MTSHSFSSPIAMRKPIENTNKIIASSGVIIFNRKWQQVGDLVEATKICAPFIFALAAIGGIVVFLYYNEDLE